MGYKIIMIFFHMLMPYKAFGQTKGYRTAMIEDENISYLIPLISEYEHRFKILSYFFVYLSADQVCSFEPFLYHIFSC